MDKQAQEKFLHAYLGFIAYYKLSQQSEKPWGLELLKPPGYDEWLRMIGEERLQFYMGPQPCL